jgi:hypothetical protein
MSQTNKRPRYKMIVPPSPDGASGQPQRMVPNRAWVGPVWGVAGFVLGIAVWHSLGFWDFVGKTVLKGDEDERRLARVDAPAGQAPALRTTGTVHGPKQIVAGYSPAAAKALRACSLAMPSTSGDETLVAPCPPSTPVAASGRLARKADFGAPVEPQSKGWSFKLLIP